MADKQRGSGTQNGHHWRYPGSEYHHCCMLCNRMPEVPCFSPLWRQRTPQGISLHRVNFVPTFLEQEAIERGSRWLAVRSQAGHLRVQQASENGRRMNTDKHPGCRVTASPTTVKRFSRKRLLWNAAGFTGYRATDKGRRTVPG